jgi:hypothetical protein
VTNSAATTWRESLDRRLNSPGGVRLLLAIFFVVAFAFSLWAVLRCLRAQSVFDYKLWYETGRHVLDGGDIYVLRFREYDFIYPPTAALLLAVASVFGQCGLIALLVIINSIAWFFCARFAARIAAGETKPNAWLYLLPSLLVIVSIWSNYHLGQPSLFLLALMLGGFVALRAKSQVLAGALIAGAAAFKAFPIAALVYLIYRRYWKASLSLVLTLVFLLLVLPAPFRGGFQRTWNDLAKWGAAMVQFDHKGLGPRPRRAQTWKNQSVVGVANRLLRHVDVDSTKPPAQPIYANVADLKFATVNAIIIAVALLLGAIFLVVMPSHNVRTSETDAIEFALLILLMLMLTPLSYGYLFAWLMLPFAVSIQRAFRNKAMLRWLIASYAVFLIALPFPLQAQARGNFFFGALVLFAGLSIELWREKRAQRTVKNGVISSVSS